jgi:hypothetical protein
MKCGPENCPLTAWTALSPNARKVKRQALAEQLYRQGFTMEQIGTQFGVSEKTISKDLEHYTSGYNVKGQGKDTLGRQKSPGRPKDSKKPGKIAKQLRERKHVISTNGKVYPAQQKQRRKRITDISQLTPAQLAKIPPAARNQEFPPDLKWEFDVQQMANFILGKNKQWTEQFGNWKQFSMTPCTYDRLNEALNMLSKLVEALTIQEEPYGKCLSIQ